METSEYHTAPCGPGLLEGWTWLADLCGLSPEGVTSQGPSLTHLLVSGERMASLEK